MPSVDKYLRASSEPGLFWEWAEGRDTKLCPRDTAIGQEHRPQVEDGRRLAVRCTVKKNLAV